MLLQFDPLYSNNWNRLEPKNRKNSTSPNRNRKWNRNRNRDNPTFDFGYIQERQSNDIYEKDSYGVRVALNKSNFSNCNVVTLIRYHCTWKTPEISPLKSLSYLFCHCHFAKCHVPLFFCFVDVSPPLSEPDWFSAGSASFLVACSVEMLGGFSQFKQRGISC